MIAVFVKDHTDTAYTMDDGYIIYDILEKYIESEDERVILDFKEIKYFSTQFFNASLSRLLIKFGLPLFNQKIFIHNLSDIGKECYDISYNHALTNIQ